MSAMYLPNFSNSMETYSLQLTIDGLFDINLLRNNFIVAKH